MATEGDTAARALLRSMVDLAGALPEAWARIHSGVTAAVTGVPVPNLNGVFVTGASRDVVEPLLDAVAATGLPHCVQLAPRVARDLAPLPASRGMRHATDVPLMVLESTAGPSTADQPKELTIRVLAPEEAGLHAQTLAAGFEAPVQIFQRLMTPDTLRIDGARCYSGEVEGQPVTTGYTLPSPGGGTGIFNIATIPAFRGRGFGAAITARAVADAAAAGSTWAWLQATAAGYAVYQRLGFRDTGRWQHWVSS